MSKSPRKAPKRNAAVIASAAVESVADKKERRQKVTVDALNAFIGELEDELDLLRGVRDSLAKLPPEQMDMVVPDGGKVARAAPGEVKKWRLNIQKAIGNLPRTRIVPEPSQPYPNQSIGNGMKRQGKGRDST